ncbi:DapH/DapD/GlmU-related protein [Flagellimonas zhangzhouensis]|uniref:Acetyltransferase (Isoleucine patch superfamily) n=1 Tax=Flagellimonas zhangzhouensis TaxID=1073328 RepID=A0A1H2YM46_9FLAO|nr:DapH/DapD/GlmU-related protein [Allomuricauda zhangzhouensis]SDR02033.1 Acetyltransferase (isoleucine patch superfamily) [Allomuricauda zhangzhouensis]SDX05888.1 Acetyltransferase (isoleucine patch superfamily) [Allomuricauda zhangzhouensis]
MGNEITDNTNDIFQRLRNGETLSFDEPDFYKLAEVAERAMDILVDLNSSRTIKDIRRHLSNLVGYQVDESTTLYTPLSSNYGKNIKLGKNIFINQNCQILDLGGVTIDDHVMIGPRVNLLSESHPVDPESRKILIAKPIHIKENAWIGAGATILPGVTIGAHAVVAAGAVVSKDVPARTVVAGIPAKEVKSI